MKPTTPPGRRRRAVPRAAAVMPPAPPESAREAGLQYVTDRMPGIRRLRAGKGFRYLGPDGRPVRDPETLLRIRALAIPPAWVRVWICPLAHGHLQATGHDDRGRKQYRYHPCWRAVRDATKYSKLLAFGLALPAIRARTEEHLALAGLPRPKVLATIVRLLETTFMRVGNEEYARENHSFGLTTLRNQHAKVSGARVRFAFRGKSGVRHEIDVRDPRLARVVKRCQELPGQELFQYIDEEGQRRAVDSADVNEYLQELTGEEFTAKDFRTWAGTVLAAEALGECGPAASRTQARRNVVRAVATVARRLGNTPAVCRNCYVHPAVIDAYLEGALPALPQGTATGGLRPEEAALLALLRQRWRQENGSS
jgi:DNA topoisomerase-1